MSAAFLLHGRDLRELVSSNASHLRQSQSSIPVIKDEAITSFLQLINTHIGMLFLLFLLKKT